MARIVSLGFVALILAMSAAQPSIALRIDEDTVPPGERLGERADGNTAVLTPEGTYIIPPPGAPLKIVREEPVNYTTVTGNAGWSPVPPIGIVGLAAAGTASRPTSDGPSASAFGGCSNYKAGWFETDSASLYGGHVGVVLQNLPMNPVAFCAGKGLGYTAGVSFAASSWIQAGLATFPGEVGAKWFCQSNDNGATSTSYGAVGAYANGATVYGWFSRDSAGIWRTYRYDNGPFSVQLPCSITRGASGNLQTFGEIQGATSSNALMGPWQMFDVRYQATSGNWFVPGTMEAYYPGGTPCPPYGAGTIAAGSFSPGTGATCTTGTRSYP